MDRVCPWLKPVIPLKPEGPEVEAEPNPKARASGSYEIIYMYDLCYNTHTATAAARSTAGPLYYLIW